MTVPAEPLSRPHDDFGFNTDVKQGDVTYHVESEALQNNLLQQTLIFVKGQCVGERAFSYLRFEIFKF